MKKITNIFVSTALAIGAVSCASEAPFNAGEEANGYGRVLTSSLAVQVQEAQTRAENVDVKDFTVKFFKTTDNETPVQQYTYKDMPEIVTLPAGADYKVIADFGGNYGEGKSAAFNAPYYYGESNEFTVSVDKIVDNLDPIKCKLSNVKVSVNFDEALVNAMTETSMVTVEVGENGSLDFTKKTTDNGYFAYVEGSTTLTATFVGSIDEVETKEIKTYKDVKPGTHYKITFRLHKPDPTGTGNVTTGDDEESSIAVDAAVEISDLGGEDGYDVTPDEEILLDDESERPTEDEDPNTPDDPNNPDDPNTPPVSSGGPVITAKEPINLDDWNDVVDGLVCELHVVSETGITKFEVDIDSTTLTPEELEGVNLDAHLDLVDSGDMAEVLTGLGLPANVGGMKEVDFSITGFLPMLSVLGPGEHKFILTVADDSGETVRTLKLRTN